MSDQIIGTWIFYDSRRLETCISLRSYRGPWS